MWDLCHFHAHQTIYCPLVPHGWQNCHLEHSIPTKTKMFHPLMKPELNWHLPCHLRHSIDSGNLPGSIITESPEPDFVRNNYSRLWSFLGIFHQGLHILRTRWQMIQIIMWLYFFIRSLPPFLAFTNAFLSVMGGVCTTESLWRPWWTVLDQTAYLCLKLTFAVIWFKVAHLASDLKLIQGHHIHRVSTPVHSCLILVMSFPQDINTFLATILFVRSAVYTPWSVFEHALPQSSLTVFWSDDSY